MRFPAPLDTDLPSALPFKKLGVAPAVENEDGPGLDFREEDGLPPSGLGGRLVTLLSPRGGCGNEFMLTVFRIVFPGACIFDTDLGWGRAVVGAGVGVTSEEDGARKPLFGVDVAERFTGVGSPAALFRVLPMGKAGRATFGGPFDGRLAGRGMVVIVQILAAYVAVTRRARSSPADARWRGKLKER